MNQILVICGPTATGKTDLAFKLAARFNGELISADSRQVYIDMDIVTGKDIPPGFTQVGDYYTNGTTRLWLTSIVRPDEPFNVSFWHDRAVAAIADIHSRGKLPIVVGVTSLYIRSLLEDLTNIAIPPNEMLRHKLADKPAGYLFNYLNHIDTFKSASLNTSDRHNPRRLIRAIEIALDSGPKLPSLESREGLGVSYINIGLSLPRDIAYHRIDARVHARIAVGAEAEVHSLLAQGYTWDMASMSTGGYLVWQDYFAGTINLETAIQRWCFAEHHDFRQVLTAAKKLPSVHWFDSHLPKTHDDIINLCQEKLKSRPNP